ncbi:MAG: hypothetical protein AAFP26_07885 [Planctomycetota bacterium]
MTDPAHDHHDENIARLGWDPDDPHGAQHHGEAKPKWGADVHHGHYIVKWQLQLGILALYWHLVDLVWIFLFPLLYLIH